MGKGKDRGVHSEIAVLERQDKVGELYLNGWPQHRIAAHLGCSQPTVSNDLAALRTKWIDSALHDFNEAKAQELAKIDNIERVAWESFDLSRAPLVIGKGAKVKGDDSPAQTGLTVKRAGDDKWLARVCWCIEMRCKIFGFVKPPEAPKQGDVNVTINWAEFAGGVPDDVERVVQAEEVKALNGGQ